MAAIKRRSFSRPYRDQLPAAFRAKRAGSHDFRRRLRCNRTLRWQGLGQNHYQWPRCPASCLHDMGERRWHHCELAISDAGRTSLPRDLTKHRDDRPPWSRRRRSPTNNRQRRNAERLNHPTTALSSAHGPARRPSGFIEPCQPSKVARPPSGPLWVHEIKHDGYRLMVRRDGSRIRCFTRNGHDWADRFPAIVEAAGPIQASSFLIDGEDVIARDDGMLDFHALAGARRTSARRRRIDFVKEEVAEWRSVGSSRL